MFNFSDPETTNLRRHSQGSSILQMLPPANEAKDLNFTITEPPLKKLKKQIEKMAAASETQSITITELSPASLKVQFQEDARLISGEIIDIVRIINFITCISLSN